MSVQDKLLAILREKEPCSIAELTKETGYHREYVANSLRTMKQFGLVTKLNNDLYIRGTLNQFLARIKSPKEETSDLISIPINKKWLSVDTPLASLLTYSLKGNVEGINTEGLNNMLADDVIFWIEIYVFCLNISGQLNLTPIEGAKKEDAIAYLESMKTFSQTYASKKETTNIP